jgi:choline dehydrogenase-like flavoprotein
MKKNLFFTLSFSLLLPFISGFCLDNSQVYDYIIVGNGTAGAVLARELSNKDPLLNKYINKVLVVEWGENRSNDPIVMSPDPIGPSNDLALNPIYAILKAVRVFFPGSLEQQYPYSESRMWGGGSAGGSLISSRGTPSVYDSWAAYTGESRWLYQNLLPYMLNIETYTPNGSTANPLQRGTSGPLFITQTDYTTVLSDGFAAALATACNTSIKSDPNDPTDGDVSVSAHQQYITPNAPQQRSYSVSAFEEIGVIVDEEGYGLGGRKLRIVNGLVSDVIINNGKAKGVRYFTNKDGYEVREVYAKKKVILCAGSSGTPNILERSGIGDPEVLEPLGIEVIVNNPNVGEHLINHYGALAALAFPGGTQAVPFLDAYYDGTSNGTAYPNLGGTPDGIRRLQTIAFSPIPNFVLGGSVNLVPRSRGRTHILSKDPSINSFLDLGMYSDGGISDPYSDASMTVKSLKMLKNVGGAIVVSPTPAEYASDTTIFAYAQKIPNFLIGYHCVGTARMGTSIIDAVCDGTLHVFGVENLMCADVSVQPFIVDANTAYSAYLIGFVAAEIIKNED